MSPLHWTLKQAKRVIIAMIGLSLLGIGIAMILLPGPAMVVIPVSLGILATEFVWARRLMHAFKERLARRTGKVNDEPLQHTLKRSTDDPATRNP